MRSGTRARTGGRLAGLALLVTAGAMILSGCLAAAGDVATGTDASKLGTVTEQDAQPQPVKDLGFDGVFKVVATLPEMKLKGGQLRFLEGVMSATATDAALQQAQIRCSNPGADVVMKSQVSGRNTSANPNVVTTVAVRWLFRAPQDGTWSCALYGMGDKVSRPDGYKLYVHKGTRLTVADSTLRGGRTWYIERDKKILGPKGWQEMAKPAYEMNPGTQSFDVYADMHITNNYEGRATNYDSVVFMKAEIYQLTEEGKSCGQTWSATARARITREVHHDKLEVYYKGIPVHLERNCTSQFRVRITVTLDSGSPIVIHGPVALKNGQKGNYYSTLNVLEH
jgi:hypothetical protein